MKNANPILILVAMAAASAGCATHPSQVRCDRHLEPINAVAAKEASPPEGRPAPPPEGRKP